MKQYSVQVFSNEVNVNADYENFDRAYEMYFKAMYSGGYEQGRLIDNETGEVYLSFKHSTRNGNWHISQFVSADAVPSIIKKEIYQR